MLGMNPAEEELDYTSRPVERQESIEKKKEGVSSLSAVAKK